MISTKHTEYLWHQMRDHAERFFVSAAAEQLDSDLVSFLPWEKALQQRGRFIAIPTDIDSPHIPSDSWKVPFNDTQLTLWNRLSPPQGDGWRSLPAEQTPLWYQHESGTLIPAWNLFGNLFDLLSFREDREDTRRDKHGRFVATYSPRHSAGLIDVPHFNESVAAVTAACVGLLKEEVPQFHMRGLLKPPVVVLSHDCDILLGNDLWTQMVRGMRVVKPLTRARLPRAGNLWWMVKNAVCPRRYYFDNLTGMIDLERSFGYKSTVYMINGTGGRFGARSGSGILSEVSRGVPKGWDKGIHYNFNTFLNGEMFAKQIEELQQIVGGKLSVGRAHYLRFDGEKSLPFLHSFGIRCDESSGYPDSVGYRNGIAGCFQPWDPSSKSALDIYEVPLTVMDAVLISQHGDHGVKVFDDLLCHLSRVGGALSIVFHPGQFHNPEHRQMLGIYHRLLLACRRHGACSHTALELARVAPR